MKEFDFHAKRTGHTKFQDKTAEVAEEEERRAREKLLQQFEEIIKVRNPNVTKNFDSAKNMSVSYADC